MQRSRVDEDWYCFHSLNLPQHTYKRNGEIDFLLMGPQELFCLEVKGGEISCHNGIWTYTDRYGVPHRSTEGPFRQAQSAMYGLRDRLKADILPDPEGAFVLGFGVVFPDSPMMVTCEEWSRDVVFHEMQMSENGFLHFIERLRSYWGTRQKQPTRLSDVRREEIRQYLRPNFEMVPSLRSRLTGSESQVVSLTEEQYRLMDSLSSMPRLLVRGGAGSGKTLLAMESARKHAAAGHQVLFLCASPLLAAVVKTRLAGDNVRVCAVGEFRHKSYGLDKGQPVLPYWAKPDSVGVLIVDEAQDSLTFAHLQLFDTVLRGGLEKGRWQVFFDPENQSGVYGDMDSDVVGYLEECVPATPALQYNCRNTNLIVTRTGIMTGVSAGIPQVTSREQVEVIWYASQHEQVGQVSRLLQNILDQEKLPPGEVSLLTMRHVNVSLVTNAPICKRSEFRVLDTSSVPEYPFRHVSIASVRDFKGLDNSVIILTDIDSLDDTALLYVGMTRARSKLYLFASRNLENQIEQRVDAYIDRLSGQGVTEDGSTVGSTEQRAHRQLSPGATHRTS